MAKRAINVIIIDEDAAYRALIRNSLMECGYGIEIMAETDSLVYGYELIRHNQPDLVFVDLRNNPEKSLDTIKRITTFFREAIVVASSSQISLEMYKAAMEAGARELLQRPLDAADIQSVVAKHEAALTVDRHIGDDSGRVVTIFSNKGGLGKTTLAVNLSLALSETIGKPVALVDLNLQLGDITTFLDVEPKQTIVDIARNIGRVDKAYLEGSLAEYTSGNGKLYVLADPLHAEDAEDLTAEQINAVLTVLKASFDYVVIDTTTSFDSKTLTALDLADHILLVSMINLPSIRSSQRLLNLFERLNYDPQKIKLIINRFMPDEEISPEDVEETLEHPIYWKIPNNYQVVMTAINRGIPISQVENSRALEKNFMELAHKLTGVVQKNAPLHVVSSAAPDREPKGLLGALFGKK